MCVERICSELDVDVPWVLCRLTLPFGFSGANYEGGDGNQLSRDTYGPYPLFIDPLSHCFCVEYSESVYLLFCQPHAQSFSSFPSAV